MTTNEDRERDLLLSHTLNLESLTSSELLKLSEIIEEIAYDKVQVWYQKPTFSSFISSSFWMCKSI